MSLEDKQVAIRRAFKKVSTEAKDRYLDEAGITELLNVSDKDIDELVADELDDQKKEIRKWIEQFKREMREAVRKMVKGLFEEWKFKVRESVGKTLKGKAETIRKKFEEQEQGTLEQIADEIAASIEGEMSKQLKGGAALLAKRKKEIKEAVHFQLAFGTHLKNDRSGKKAAVSAPAPEEKPRPQKCVVCGGAATCEGNVCRSCFCPKNKCKCRSSNQYNSFAASFDSGDRIRLLPLCRNCHLSRFSAQ